MVRSILEPDLLLRIILKKKQQLGEIEQDLENLPLDHPERLRLFERRLHLEKSIPALEAEAASSSDPHSKSTPVQSKLAKEPPKEKLVFTRRNGKTFVDGKVDKVPLRNTFDVFTNILTQVRALVVEKKGRVTIQKVKNTFGRTELATAAENADWNNWIEIFGSKPPATAKGAALVFLEKKTGLNRNTIEKYCSNARNSRK